jgi:hypothetical protein
VYDRQGRREQIACVRGRLDILGQVRTCHEKRDREIIWMKTCGWAGNIVIPATVRRIGELMPDELGARVPGEMPRKYKRPVLFSTMSLAAAIACYRRHLAAATESLWPAGKHLSANRRKTRSSKSRYEPVGRGSDSQWPGRWTVGRRRRSPGGGQRRRWFFNVTQHRRDRGGWMGAGAKARHSRPPGPGFLAFHPRPGNPALPKIDTPAKSAATFRTAASCSPELIAISTN